ncbi:MAG: RagB/SusD family nutrient uptake outer membrane protein [Bacteroidales bacterium]|nr:RagB/SusD family nutrient uptake outer membrane protein [Bacteroidales bacterium]
MNLINKLRIKTSTLIGAMGLLIGASSLYSCVDDINVGEDFLEKQPGVDVTMDTIFAKGENAKRFLWHMYGAMHNAFTYTGAVWYSSSDALTDICQSYCGWHNLGSYYGGDLTETAQDNGGFVKFPFIANGDGNARVGIWRTIREGWIFIENIDRVPDLSESEKSQLRGETYVIMASRYLDAFRNFGGLPKVDRSYESADVVDGKRMTVLETAEFIDGLIQSAIDEPGLPFYVQDQATNSGRLTKGSAYGLRVKLWNFVASPLFNNDKPYMEFTRNEENQDLHQIWTGGYQAELWTKALKACEDFFAANASNGNYFALVQPTGTTEQDYCNAYRAAYWFRGNSEKLIEVHAGAGNNPWNGDWNVEGMDEFGMALFTLEYMEMFGMADGRNFPYDNVFNTNNPDNIDMFANRDPRLYETMVVNRNNLVEQYKGLSSTELWEGGNIDQTQNPAVTDNPWSTRMKLFKYIRDDGYAGYYPANYAYLRMADIHYCYAEALAQTGNLTKACEEMNKVRARVGLGKVEQMNPELNLTSNKDNFIEQLMKERACEFGFEDHRWYDLIRYKRSDIFKKQVHQLRIWRKDANGNKMDPADYDGNTSLEPGEPWPSCIYEKIPCTNNIRVWWDTDNQTSKWSDKWYLSPISRDEINKGYGLNQNPGW